MKKVEIFLKNLLLRLLLLLSKKKKRRSVVTEFDNKSKLLFIRLNRIGDALVTTPLLKQIKEELKCNITVLAAKSNQFIFSNNPSVDNVLIFNKGIGGIFEVLRNIKEEKYDAVIDLHDDVSTTVTYIMALCSAENKFGLKKGNEIVYTKTIEKLDSEKYHVVDRILQLGKLFSLKPPSDDINIEYCPQKASIEKMRKALSKRFETKKLLIGVNISAGSYARFWGVDRFQKLLAFLANYDVNVIVICSPKDINLALQIVKNDSKKIIYSPSFDE
ncbi:MAG: glycosyltransferase family 9 protein, partial [Bacteroidota bacterium]|nr:glycosyltransferase family 9 protein [Bacteroidota bacterium]